MKQSKMCSPTSTKTLYKHVPSRHHVLRRVGEEGLEVFGHDADDAAASGGSCPRNVGRDEGVGGGENGMIGRRRFGGEDIAGVGAETTGLQGFGHRDVVNQCAARRVDENQTGGGSFQNRRVDEGAVLLREGAVERHDARGGKGFVEGDFAHAGRERRFFLRGDGAHFRFEHTEEFGNFAPDIAHTDEGNAHAAEFFDGFVPQTEIATARPVTFAVQLRIVSHAVGDFEEQGEGVLRHGERAICGHIADGDSTFAGGGHVYHIIARGGHQNQAELGETVEDFGRDAHFVEDDHFGIGRTRHDLCARRALVDGELTLFGQRSPIEIAGVEYETVEKNDTGHNEVFMEKEAKNGERAETNREPAEMCSASALIVAA